MVCDMGRSPRSRAGLPEAAAPRRSAAVKAATGACEHGPTSGNGSIGSRRSGEQGRSRYLTPESFLPGSGVTASGSHLARQPPGRQWTVPAAVHPETPPRGLTCYKVSERLEVSLMCAVVRGSRSPRAAVLSPARGDAIKPSCRALRRRSLGQQSGIAGLLAVQRVSPRTLHPGEAICDRLRRYLISSTRLQIPNTRDSRTA